MGLAVYTALINLSNLFIKNSSMARYSTNEFKNGLKIILDGQPCSILHHEFHKPGKGQAVMRVKLRNLLTNAVLDKTFKTGESVDGADIQEVSMQYLYKDTDMWCFMRTDETYEQVFIDKIALGETSLWLKEEEIYTVLFWDSNPISVTPPNIVELKVIDSPPGIKGNTASGGNKPVTLETGVTVNVPLFVSIDDIVKVNTQTKTYLGRVKS